MITYLSTINLIIALLWFLSAAVDYADFCYLWQLKEYRYDRFRDFLNTDKGRKFWLRYSMIWRSVIAMVILFMPINQVIYSKYLIITIFLLDLIYNLFRYSKKKLRRPVITIKAITIILFCLVIEGSVFITFKDWSLPLVLLILRFINIALIIIIINLASFILKSYLIKKAAKKMSQYPNIKVVGITGSYGKTSVKNFLYHVLQDNFNVIKTPRNINTEIGVAKFILNENLTGVEVFICEMGAYKIGEIQKICDMVHPKIGILTAINEQHLSLFGSLKNTQQAKYELLRSLPETGLAVVNSDNPLCREFLPELKCQVNTFGIEEEYVPTMLIKDVQKVELGLKFVGFYNNVEGEVIMPIWGEHNVMNVAPCYLVGMYLGMKREEVRERCRTLKMPNGILDIKNYGSCTIIDDSYNSNPEGFKAALVLLNSFPSQRKRIVITRGMLELGEKSSELHQKIGEEISFVADELIIINSDNDQALRSGIAEKYRTNVRSIYSALDLLEYVKSLKNSHSVILVENRISSLVGKEIFKKKLL